MNDVSHWHRFKEWTSKITVAEVGMLFLTLVIAGSSIVYTRYAKRQWKAMSSQLSEMQASGRQTDQMLGLLRQQLEQITNQTSDTHELAAQAKNQSGNTEKLASATNMLAYIAKKNFAATRPFIVVEHSYLTANDQGMKYDIWIANNSGVGANSFLPGCEVYLDERHMPPEIAKVNPTTVGPWAHFSICEAEISNKYAIPIRTGFSTLRLYVHATYSGPAGNYAYCVKEEYVSQVAAIATIGDCDASKPFPQ